MDPPPNGIRSRRRIPVRGSGIEGDPSLSRSEQPAQVLDAVVSGIRYQNLTGRQDRNPPGFVKLAPVAASSPHDLKALPIRTENLETVIPELDGVNPTFSVCHHVVRVS